jgi:hypothetical protein
MTKTMMKSIGNLWLTELAIQGTKLSLHITSNPIAVWMEVQCSPVHIMLRDELTQLTSHSKTVTGFRYPRAEAGTITFILISDQIVDHCSKIDLRSYQDHMAVK